MIAADDSKVTCDSLLRGRVKFLQPAKGFRSSLDPVLLAGFVRPPVGELLDIGCASGLLAFLLLAKDPLARGVGVEIQPRLAALAEQGTLENGFAGRLRIVAGDARQPDLLPHRSFDSVVINPPFRPVGAGVLPPLSEKALANHEVTLTLSDWVAVAERALRADGRLFAIYPFDRSGELREELRLRGLCLGRTRAVLPRDGELATRILIEAGRSLEALPEPPLVVHDGDGYSAEVRTMLGEDKMKYRLAYVLAIWFGCGRFPKMPGTVGTIGAIPLYYLLVRGGPLAVAIGAVIVSLVGVWAATQVVRRTGLADPQIVCIDEVAGVLITLTAAPNTWRGLLAGVVLFRLADQFKPFPARRAESLREGWGVVMDDVFAGLWGAAVLLVARRLGWL